MDENMRPKHFPVGGWLIIIGVIMLLIGILSWKVTGGAERYVQLSDLHMENEAEAVRRIDIDTGSAEITLTASPSATKLTVEAENFPKEELGLGVQDDTLRIYRKRKVKFIGISTMDILDKTTRINIIVPEKLYDELNIDAGSGKVRISGISADKADIDHGAGECVLENCIFSEMDLDCGAGSCEFKSCVCGSADIDCGAGDLKYQGEINDNSSIDCGVGELNIELAASYHDYDIDIDKGAGDVDIDKGSLPSTGRSIKLDINCGVGNVTVKFK